MNKVIVTFSDNWADEMDLGGYSIMTEDEWNEISNKISSIKRSFEIGFGSNESNEYSNGLDYLKNFSVNPITEEEIKIISKFSIPSPTFGNLDIDIDDEDIDDEDSDEEKTFCELCGTETYGVDLCSDCENHDPNLIEEDEEDEDEGCEECGSIFSYSEDPSGILCSVCYLNADDE